MEWNGFKIKTDETLKKGEWYFLDEAGEVSDKMWDGKSSLSKAKFGSFLGELGDGIKPLKEPT